MGKNGASPNTNWMVPTNTDHSVYQIILIQLFLLGEAKQETIDVRSVTIKQSEYSSKLC